jgi:hypothetical protein
VVWHQFVLHCIEHGYAGVENLSLTPVRQALHLCRISERMAWSSKMSASQ